MSVIFVGEVTNPPGLDPKLALTGSSGRHLATLAGLSTAAYLRYRRYNIDVSGAASPATRAQEARRIEATCDPGSCIVMLGRETIRAFGFADNLRWFMRATGATGVTLVAFPHPSHHNRFWNDEGSEEEAARVLQEIVREFG